MCESRKWEHNVSLEILDGLFLDMGGGFENVALVGMNWTLMGMNDHSELVGCRLKEQSLLAK